MKAYTVVRMNATLLGRMAFETAPANRNNRLMYEVNYNAGDMDPSSAVHGVSMVNPVNVFFTDTEESAKALAVTLAQFNPGTQWQWFKSAGIATSPSQPLAEELINVKKITEKGLLP